MGEVYLADDERLHRKVALKLLPPELVDDPERRRRFEQESTTLAALNHANIVTIHSIEESAGRPFIVMEWIRGRPLSEVIGEHGLPLDRLLDIALPLLDAVGAAHEVGIVHRDLKPGNVMIRSDGAVKVVDFGLSKLGTRGPRGSEALTLAESEALSRPGQVVGTIQYMAPEQLTGGQVDARSDIFALGILLFEMATGETPFKGDDLVSRLSSVLQAEPVRVASLKRELPAELDEVVARCLRKDPSERPQSVGELRAPLQVLRERLAAGVYIESARERRRRRWVRRTGLGLAALALLALLLWKVPGMLPRDGGAGHGGASPAAVPGSRITAVAVLPLRNLSGDPEEEFLSDGVTEALIANLAKVGAFRVISRNSVMRFKGSEQPTAEIARQLNVDKVLQGSVARSEQGLMIVVRLDDPATGDTIWGDSYFTDLDGIFDVQRQVVEEVARMTEVQLRETERQALEPQVTSSEVYELYLRGRYFWNRRTPDSLQRALDLFGQAIELDPSYALAHSGIAETYALMATFGFGVLSPEESAARTREAALQALEIDPELSEAHTSLAMSLTLEWSWSEAVRAFERATELNPSNAVAHQHFAGLLTALGRHDEAIERAARARRLDPLSLIIGQAAAAARYFAGDYAGAAELARAGLELEPDFWVGHTMLGSALSLMGEWDEADEHLGRAAELTRRNPYALAARGMNYVRWGRIDEARSLLDEILAMTGSRPVSATLVGKLYVGLGDLDEGFEWLDRALANRDHTLIYLAVDPDFAAIVDDPRAEGLIEAMDLPGAARAAPAVA